MWIRELHEHRHVGGCTAVDSVCTGTVRSRGHAAAGRLGVPGREPATRRRSVAAPRRRFGEWIRRDSEATSPRVALVGTAWTAAFVVYQGGPALLSGPVPGGEDFFASLGLIVSFAVIGVVWRRRGWGPLLPAYCLLLIATSVVHAVVVPFWDVSSHVVYAAVPTGYLAAVERRFAVLFAAPLGLTWSRIALNAHTPRESLGGLALAAVIVAIAIVADRDVTGRTDLPK